MLIFRGLTLIVLKNQQITPFPAELRALGGGFLPDISAAPRCWQWLTVILGVGAPVALLIQAVKERRIRKKFGPEKRTHGLVRHQDSRFIALLMLTITFLLASYRGTPIVLIMLAVLVIVYYGSHEQQRLRPAHLRDRRQPARGRALRHQDQARHLPGSSSTWASSPPWPASFSRPG